MSDNGYKVYASEQFVEDRLSGLNTGGTQPDWNQNDETASDYIKNRPFYSTITKTENVLLEETTAEIVDTDDGYYVQISDDLLFEEGKTYTVTFNGTQYECVARKWVDVDNGYAYLIGNGLIYGDGLGNNEPFCCDTAENRVGYLNVSEEGTYTISIALSETVENIAQIDDKYISGIEWEKIKNKPFGITSGPLTWDGDATGKHVVDSGSMKLVKVYDTPVTYDDLVGATIVVSSPEGDQTITLTADDVEDLSVGPNVNTFVASDPEPQTTPVIFVLEAMICNALEDFSMYGMSFEKGIYFLHVPEENMHVSFLDCINVKFEKIHKLDNKFIDAEWMAKGNSVETLFDKEITFTDPMCPLSDEIPIEIGKEYTVTWNGTLYTCVAEGVYEDDELIGVGFGNISFMMEGIDSGHPFIVIASDYFGEGVKSVIYNIELIMATGAPAPEPEFTVTLKIKCGKIDTLPHKFLDFINAGEGKGGDTLTWDGNTSDLTSVMGILYKITDIVPSLDDLSNGGTIIFSTPDGEMPMPFSSDVVQVMSADLIAIDDFCIFALNDTVFEGMQFEKGTYFHHAGEDGFLSALTINGFVFATQPKIKNEFLDMDYIKSICGEADNSSSKIPEFGAFVLKSTTEGSNKRFLITINDDGEIHVNEYTPPEVLLIDFEYTDNGDGTYTITDWKGTLNGEESVDLVVPDDPSIIF